MFNDYPSSRKTTQRSKFRPIISPFRSLRKTTRQQTQKAGGHETKREQGDKSKPASPLPIVPAWMCFLSVQHAATVQTSLWRRARQASFLSPWHDEECESRESHNSGYTNQPDEQLRAECHRQFALHLTTLLVFTSFYATAVTAIFLLKMTVTERSRWPTAQTKR